MRVTGGSARGTPLVAPRGADTRPTTDRVREAIFSILFSLDAGFERVLDLYAGTGALAIEALSRGDGSAVLVDRAPAAQASIRRNLRAARVEDRAELLAMPVRQALERLTGRSFSLVFVDPPYDEATASEVLEQLVPRGLLAPDAVIVYEHAWRRPLSRCPDGLALIDDRRYGDTGVAIFRRTPV